MAIGDRSVVRGAIRGALQSLPLAAILFGTAAGQAQPTIAPASVDRLVDELVVRLGRDQQFINATNQEPPAKSRVVRGSAWAAIGGGIAAVPVLLDMVMNKNFDLDAASMSISSILGGLVALAGACYALYGRLKKGLRPL